jgi:hypothetical protein
MRKEKMMVAPLLWLASWIFFEDTPFQTKKKEKTDRQTVPKIHP